MNLSNDYSILTDKARLVIGSTTKLFIDGYYQEPTKGQYYSIVDPSNDEHIAQVARACATDVDKAVDAATRAFETGVWASMRPHEREAAMLRLAELLIENGKELSELETLSSGKLISNTRAFDVDFSVYTLRYMAGWSTKISGQSIDLSVPYLPDEHFSGSTMHFPIGVVAAITPWNVPLCQAIWKLAPVLATGCTVVIKPAEQTPLTTLRLAQLCIEAGIPSGVVNVITGYGSEAGKMLVEHPGVNKVTFTGSTGTGKLIGATAASQMKACTLELGGKSPVIIAEDADLTEAIPGAAWAIWGNHGQNCCAGSRLLVHHSIYNQVVEGVKEIAESLKLGPGLNPYSQMGPLVHKEHRQNVLNFIKSGLEAGGELITGGYAVEGPGAYIEPTIIASLSADAHMVQNEIFGPVLSVFSYRDDEEAIALANSTSFGLGASIWSKNVDRIDKYFRRLSAGMVWVNNHNVIDLALPFGGHKDSGMGKELGYQGMISHTKIKTKIYKRNLGSL
ncbi:aldehyde dehydrogenase [Marinomonas sp. CT5]|uniref:aldehyde dehydrogenase family protein n=1 Tax=Marinomonas sp. CT5 TaxID=2066133 RepID=UPI001BB0678B|nr:aldehyde dehydrogenase family protein [Marinomonas sp. CT5]QUX97160.1 aldehyde dehydrogenase [Marinomonas sp. CT5]